LTKKIDNYFYIKADYLALHPDSWDDFFKQLYHSGYSDDEKKQNYFRNHLHISFFFLIIPIEKNVFVLFLL